MACTCEISVSYKIATEIPVSLTPFVITPTGTFNGKEMYEWTDATLGTVAIIWNSALSRWTFVLMPSEQILAYLPNPAGSDCPSFFPLITSPSGPGGSSYTVTEIGVDNNLTEFIAYLNCEEDLSCDCEITLNFTSNQLEEPVSIVLTLGGTINGRDSYTFSQTFSAVNYTFLVFWNNSAWEIIVTSPSSPNPSVAILLTFYICPIDAIETWEINLLWAEFFSTINTVSSCDPCYSWESVSNTFPGWFTPWNFYTLVLTNADYNNFYVGQIVYNLDSINPFTTPGSGILTVASLIFVTPTNVVYHEPIYGAQFFGIVLKDEFGNLVSPGLSNDGYICLEPPAEPIDPTQDEINKECFDILVWNKQCEFSKCVLSFLNKLQLGIYNCEEFEKLKNTKRVLEILNCYDTRDIENNTTVYNNLTYSQIKKLLNY